MLAEIYIRNYILVPELRIRFESGLTVITGETGAGKSILVGSVALIFGDSAAGLEAYDPSSPIYLETSFIPNQDPLLREYLNQINADWEEELVLAREISVNGKSSYFVGGRKVSAQVLKNLKPLLLDFHHQRDQQKLLSAAYQLELLDRYADSTGLCADFAMAFKELKSKQRQLQEMQKQEEMQQQRLELYRYQYAELEKADIQAGEDTDLQQEFELQSHGKEIQELALGMNLALMESENSIVDQLGQFQAQLEHYRRLNPQIEDAASLLVEATEALRNTAQTLSSLTDNISFDPGRLSYLESRLDTINNLLYKHRVHNVEELLQLFQKRQKEIASADDFQQQIIALQESIAIGMQELAQKADKLSAIRRTAALALAEELQNSIRQLALAQSSIQIRIDKNAA
ncbi:MAG TPA: DNA repair protein RecN, partial [Candidatus Cloacimonadota bacterium]|nr:DNA repair protein RecN [Candidatus Cloacimonadota bacterium]